MSTLIETPRAIDIPMADGGQGVFDEVGAARYITQKMDIRFPESAPFVAVPGGPADGNWNFFAKGNAYRLPSEEEAEYAAQLCEEVVCNSDDFWSNDEEERS